MRTVLRRCLGAGIFLLGGLGAPTAYGQAGWLTLSGGYGGATLKWPTMTQFMESYVKANPTEITGKLTLGGGTVQSVLADVAGFGCIGFQRLTATPVARFSTGGERTFAIRQNLFVVGIEPSLQRKHFFVGGVFGMHAGTMRVGSSYRYPDGTRSWGADRPLNGDYGGLTLGGYLGAKAGLTWKLLAVTARVEYFSKGLVKEGLSDKSGGKNTTANAFGGVASPDFLPLDYPKYIASPYEYTAVDQAVANDLSSLRAQLQIGLLLFPLDTD